MGWRVKEREGDETERTFLVMTAWRTSALTWASTENHELIYQ